MHNQGHMVIFRLFKGCRIVYLEGDPGEVLVCVLDWIWATYPVFVDFSVTLF